MALRRTDAESSHPSRGRSPRQPMNIPYQHQHYQSTLPSSRFHNNGGTTQGSPLGRNLYAMENLGVACAPVPNTYSTNIDYLYTIQPPHLYPMGGNLYAMENLGVVCAPLPNNYSTNIDYHHTIQPPHLYPSFFTTLPIYTQTLPVDTQVIPINALETMGDRTTIGSHNYNQLNHNVQPRSDDVVSQTSGRTSTRDEKDGPNTRGSHLYSQHNDILKHKANDAANDKSESTSSKDEENNSYRFGLRGLVDSLRGRNSDVTTLAMGRGYETFSVYDNMYGTHNFPWSARTPNPPPPYNLPSCYLGHQVSRLNARFIATLRRDTLFYIFYSMPNDEAQLIAANELYNRRWVYHKNLGVWLKRSGNDEREINGDIYEKGSYVYFDPQTWSCITKENFTLFYEMVERRPSWASRKANN